MRIPVSKAAIWLLFFAAREFAAQPPELVALTSAAGDYQPVFREAPMPGSLLQKMAASTWHEGCPVSLSDLRLLDLSYWNFTGLPSLGHLIVHKDLAKETVAIFQELYQHGFLIERMEPVENFGGSDDLSMAANNTSAFNCRDVTGKPGRFSNHSWGRAIDINPLTNPYLLGSKVLPPQGARYLDRSKAAPGSILAASFIVQLFQRHGWTWGGAWHDAVDYQHFEKPAPGRT